MSEEPQVTPLTDAEYEHIVYHDAGWNAAEGFAEKYQYIGTNYPGRGMSPGQMSVLFGLAPKPAH